MTTVGNPGPLTSVILLTGLAASFLLAGITGLNAYASDLKTSLAIEGRLFFEDAQHPGQKDDFYTSFLFQAEYRHKFEDSFDVFTFAPFYRYDLIDRERTHADIRQLDYIGVLGEEGDFEYQIGISKVFWGVTESLHLVDIINQTDGVENPDGEDKLGQPLVRLSYLHDWGSLSVFALPYFRERTFPGREGRLRTEFPVADQDVQYESSKEEHHIDYAIRLQHTFGGFDAGISYFDGTSREPELSPDFAQGVLRQFYPQIGRTGLDFQYTGDVWLGKLEAIYEESNLKDYGAAVGGFEYTMPRFLESRADVEWILEYLYDSRGELVSVPFQNDIFAGARFVFNDLKDIQLLVGSYTDLDNDSKSFIVEGSARLLESLVLTVDALIFADTDDQDTFKDLERDSFVEFEVEYFF